MSRYQITTSEHTIILGWDRPLQTYFAQVWKGEPESPENDHPIPGIGPVPTLWLGCGLEEVATVEELAEHLRPFLEIPSGIRSSLENDRGAR